MINDVANINIPVEELLCLMAIAHWSEEEQQRAQRLVLCLEYEQWNLLLELAQFNAVIPMVFLKLVRLEVLDHIRKKRVDLTPFLQLIDSISVNNGKRAAKGLEIYRAFAQRGIKLVLLKGALFSKRIYRNENYKKMNDIDLLIEKKNIEEGKKIFRELNLKSVGELFGELDAGKTHHTSPYVSSNLDCVTGLHWDLASPYSPYKTEISRIFSELESFDHQGITLWSMSLEDNLYHLAIHLPFYKIGLRELADVSNLVRNATRPVDWDKFKKIVDYGQAWNSVYRVLTLADALIPFSFPERIREWAKERALSSTVRDTEKRSKNRALLLLSRSTFAAKLEKYFVIHRFSSLASEKVGAIVKTWQELLFPDDLEARRIYGVIEWRSWWQKVVGHRKFVFLIWHAMALDHGMLALTIMTAINIINCFKIIIKYPFIQDGVSLKDHPHFRLLKMLE